MAPASRAALSRPGNRVQQAAVSKSLVHHQAARMAFKKLDYAPEKLMIGGPSRRSSPGRDVASQQEPRHRRRAP
jgi:hypothetical protein